MSRRTSPKLLDGALVVGDGTQLPLQVWQPAREPVAVMIALHGFADWRRSFDVSAPLFASRGIVVYAYDQRGFGDTRSRGTWPGVEALVTDLSEAAGAIAARHPDLPQVLLGESTGASLALVAAARAEPPLADALLLAAPGVPRAPAGRTGDDIAFRLANVALPWSRAELQRGGQPWLLPEEAKRLASDPKMVRELGIETHEGLVELARLAGDVGRGHLPPTLILHGALDTTVPEEAIKRLASRLEPRAALLSYPNRHHLLLHEEDVDRVVDDCVAWLEPLLPTARARRQAAVNAPEGPGVVEDATRETLQQAAQQPRQIAKAAE